MTTFTIEKVFFSMKSNQPLLPFSIILLLLINSITPAYLSTSQTIRSRRWLQWGDEITTTTPVPIDVISQQQNQPLTIPAANPNFEAAFQGKFFVQ